MCDTKKCSKCGEVKGLAEFGKHSITRSGLRDRCKVCNREYAASWRKENPKKAAKKDAEWARNNRDKRVVICTKYREANRSQISQSEKARKNKISDGYAAQLIGLRISIAPPELLALKREQLAIKRMARELKKAATKPTGENE